MSAAPGGVVPPEEQLLRSASRRIAAQSALAVVLLLAAVGAVVFVLDRQASQRSAQDALRSAVLTANDVQDPPGGVLLVLRDAAGRVRASPRTPAAAAAGQLLGRAPGPSGYTDPAGVGYQVLTAVRPGGVRLQALFDNRRGEQERHRLVTALLLADALGAVGAAGVALLLARRAIRPLSDALRLQRRFVADASHELRAPLTLLHTRSQLLLRETPADGPLADQLAGLVRDTRSLGEIVEDLLAAAELPHRAAPREPVDLSALAAQVVAAFSASAQAAGVTLTLQAQEQVLVPGAATSLRRAVSALVDNAVGHVHPGGSVTVTVSTTVSTTISTSVSTTVATTVSGTRCAGRSGQAPTRPAGRGAHQWARLSVRDTGVGLDPGASAALFARFARGSDSPGPGRRFGLGLALVRDVVTAHGGHVSVDGAPGVGASFVVVLPALG